MFAKPENTEKQVKALDWIFPLLTRWCSLTVNTSRNNFAEPVSVTFLKRQAIRVTARKQVKLTSDGCCIRNPGPGGWACVLRFDQQDPIEIFGCEKQTTNNQMELRGAIEGLKFLREEPHIVTLATDSQYLKLGATGKLRLRKNEDLWKELKLLRSRHEVSWIWVKGHSDDKDNLRADFLAKSAAREQIHS